MKEIIIIDAFITNSKNESKLSEFIQSIKKINIPILLVSNTIISGDIIKEVDYYLYDSDNRLFKDIFDSYETMFTWNVYGDIKCSDVHPHKQPHALSVMVNLFNSLNFIKSLGYTHFHRIEYDTVLGDLTLDKIKKTSQKVNENGKKGYFTINTPDHPSHRFQYFFSEIKYFFQIIPLIRNQNDYLNLLTKLYGECKTFHPIEKVMYDLIHNDSNLLIEEVRNAVEFQDSIWNTETTQAHREPHQKICKTEFYKDSSNGIILSENYSNQVIERLIIFYMGNEKLGEVRHILTGAGHWIWNLVPESTDNIIISENEMIINKIWIDEKENYIENL